LTGRQALAFVRRHGVVLAAARGPVPSVAEAVLGGPFRGSWWGHPRGGAIFAALGAIEESPDVLACRLVSGKVTFVHRRVWPALVRLAARFPRERLAWVRQEHTPAGHHVSRVEPYPRWVPQNVRVAARKLSSEDALAILGPWVSSATR
jgi:hypothetical protein